MANNIILATDSYKVGHHKFYPEGTRHVFSYGEPRQGSEYDYALFQGMAYFVRNYLMKPVTMDDIDQAERILVKHLGGFNRAGWEYIVNQHGGWLPVEIRAPREGTIVPANNALFSIVNTDPEVPWITSYVETALLRAIWYPTTVASKVLGIRNLLAKYLKLTTGGIEGLEYMLHDFGARGGTSSESVKLASMAHQMLFEGSDSVEGLLAVEQTYDDSVATATSIDATEHSIMTAKMKEGEPDQVRRLLDQTDDDAIIACVADSYNIYKFVDEILTLPDINKRIKERPGRFVVRPDSGDPAVVVTEILKKLERVFGSTTNAKGYKVLNYNVGVIQGDGLSNVDDFDHILDRAVMMNAFCTSNLAFGMGGGIHQLDNRDTMRWAMKCSARQGRDVETIDGWMDIFKDPVHGGKTSKKGRLSLFTNTAGDIGAMQTCRVDHNNVPIGWTDYTNVQDVFEDWYYSKDKYVMANVSTSFDAVKAFARDNANKL